MRHLKTTLALLGGATVLVLAGNTVALAATGGSFLLGKSNSANAQTTLTRTTAGAVLNLKGTSTTGSPLAVNGKGKVANLNADTVDGFDSTVLRDKVYVFTRSISSGQASTSYSLDLPVPTGTYEVGYSVFPNGAFADDGSITCYVTVHQNGSSIRYVGENRSTQRAGNRPAVSGSGVVQLTSTQDLKLDCNSTTAFYTFSNQPVQVYVSPTTFVGVSSNLRAAAPRPSAKN